MAIIGEISLSDQSSKADEGEIGGDSIMNLIDDPDGLNITDKEVQNGKINFSFYTIRCQDLTRSWAGNISVIGYVLENHEYANVEVNLYKSTNSGNFLLPTPQVEHEAVALIDENFKSMCSTNVENPEVKAVELTETITERSVNASYGVENWPWDDTLNNHFPNTSIDQKDEILDQSKELSASSKPIEGKKSNPSFLKAEKFAKTVELEISENNEEENQTEKNYQDNSVFEAIIIRSRNEQIEHTQKTEHKEEENKIEKNYRDNSSSEAIMFGHVNVQKNLIAQSEKTVTEITSNISDAFFISSEDWPEESTAKEGDTENEPHGNLSVEEIISLDEEANSTPEKKELNETGIKIYF